MKRYGLIVLFIWGSAVARVSGSVGVWPIESFRLQGTGTIEDDIDWALDPIDIQRIDGYRVYTNLSNLITYSETPLGDSTANQYLLGFSGSPISPLPGLKSAIIIKKDKLFVPNDVSLVFPHGIFVEGKGFIKATRMRWIPPHYESYEFWEKSGRDEFSTDGHVYFINNSFSTGTFTIGVASPFLGRSYTYTTAGTPFRYAYRRINRGNASFEDNYKFYYSDIDTITVLTSDKGEFSTVNGLAIAPWELSFAIPVQETEIRASLGIIPFKSKYEVEDKFSATHDSATHTRMVIRYFDESENISVVQREDGKIFSIGGGIKRDFIEKVTGEEEYYEEKPEVKPKKIKGYIKGEISIGFISGNGDSTFRDTFKRTRRHGSGTLVATWVSDFNDFSEYKCGLSGFLFNVGGRGVIPISDNVILGACIDIEYQKTKREGDTKENDIHTLTFNDGDEQPNDSDDYKTITITTEDGDITTDESIWDCKLPIGLEYKFTKNRNWAFRIGAIPSFTSNNIVRIINVTSPKVTTEITTYGDGSVDTTIVREDFFPTQREEAAEFIQLTRYTYGLGWCPTKNLQVDLLAFLAGDGSILDLSTYQKLRLSITLKF